MSLLNLRELRKTMGITQSNLAEAIGVSFQTISKWESGIATPDVKNVVSLARFFGVTTDQILGLQPIHSAYLSRLTDTAAYWNKKLDYISGSRVELWNIDYMEFLIHKVWRIEKPVKILDFGCGNGYLAGLLMPFMPKGSTYLGIDISDVLIRDAQSKYAHSEYKIEFICKNGYDFGVKEQYDIVMCQAFLRELSNPLMALKNMISALKKNATIICIEVNRELDNAGFFVEGIDYYTLLDADILREYWKAEYEMKDRDYAIGIRLPFLLNELGIEDIEVRLQDKVKFANSRKSEEYDRLLNAFILEKNWQKDDLSEDRYAIDIFTSRGLSKEVAEQYIAKQRRMMGKIIYESFLYNLKLEMSKTH